MRLTVPILMLITLFSGHAAAYQYARAAPYPYQAPPGYFHPYAFAAYPYHPVRRYPVQQQAHNRAGTTPPVIGGRPAPALEATEPTAPVEPKPQAAKTRGVQGGEKQAFINDLLPYIEQENRRLTRLREEVAGLFGKLENGVPLSQQDQQRIRRISKKYRVSGNPIDDGAARYEVLARIDIIPSSLALAQAVNESAWGQSRFAQQANNLFGIWTYDESKGMKPLNREKGKTHLVRIFEDVGESVRYYMHTLNSHPAYRELRDLRQQLRDSGQTIDGHKLAAGLEKYSAKGQDYIVLIRSLIRQNDWARLDGVNPRA